VKQERGWCEGFRRVVEGPKRLHRTLARVLGPLPPVFELRVRNKRAYRRGVGINMKRKQIGEDRERALGICEDWQGRKFEGHGIR